MFWDSLQQDGYVFIVNAQFILAPSPVFDSSLSFRSKSTSTRNSSTDNWQKFCLSEGDVLLFLMTISYSLDEGVAPLLLQLMQAAICSSGSSGNGKSEKNGSQQVKQHEISSERAVSAPDDYSKLSRCGNIIRFVPQKFAYSQFSKNL